MNENANDAFDTHISSNVRNYDSFADYRDGFFAGYEAARTPATPVQPDKLADNIPAVNGPYATSGELFHELGMPPDDAARAERGLNAVLRREQMKRDNVAPSEPSEA